MMRRCHEQILDEIILDCLHSLDALTTTVLTLEVIDCHTLYIAKLCHSDYNIFLRNQIFNCDIIIHINADRSSSVIAIFCCDDQDFLLDYTKEQLLICENCLQLFDEFHQFSVFFLKLLSFQTGQSTQTHIYDSLCLCIGQTETLDQCKLCIGNGFGTTDDLNNLINIIEGYQ